MLSLGFLLFIIFLALVVAEFQLLFFVLPVFLTRGGAPYVPSRKEDIAKMISLAKIKPDDKAVDLGSGDGRIVIALARKGIEAHGYEISPALVLWSRIKIYFLGLSGLAFIHSDSFWNADLSDFSLVTLFGFKKIMGDLETKLDKELKPNSRIISNMFKMPNWQISGEDNGVYEYVKISRL